MIPEQIPENLYKQLVTVSKHVKNDLKRHGIAVPVENPDGTISLGTNRVLKKDNFYAIMDYSGEVIIDKINLPQTAILLANSLALGRFIDPTLLASDRKYGYSAFEEQLHSVLAERLSKTDPDRADVMIAKSRSEKYKKEHQKRYIMKRFEKLLKFA
jgi:hypothetical protein